ncbi:MAG: SRPBCC domain-containing protein [Xanthobacteraceae bacterium]|nr:SRPBCC domain-containing protein [Xanthobacteraceae bacterium]
MLAKPSVTLKRHIHGKPEQVFAAWTDPKKIVRWFGPQQTLLDSVKAELDVRVGGKFSVSFATDDGEFHKVGGTYREIFPPERLQFTWAWHTTPERESLVTVTIRPDGEGSMLTLLHEQFFDQAAADGHKRGWTGTLEKLAATFEQGSQT